MTDPQATTAYPHLSAVRDLALSGRVQADECRHAPSPRQRCKCGDRTFRAFVGAYLAMVDAGWTVTPPVPVVRCAGCGHTLDEHYGDVCDVNGCTCDGWSAT